MKKLKYNKVKLMGREKREESILTRERNRTKVPIEMLPPTNMLILKINI